MTNAEVYIGDEDLIDQFIDEFNKFACKQDWDLECHCLKERLVEFFKQERTPTLTEEEKTILRHISKEYTEIGRDSKEELYLVEMVDTIHSGKYLADIFADDVFGFIKVGEQYEIKELLKDD